MKLGVITGNLGMFSDKFITTGYQPEKSFEDKVRAIEKIPLVKGVELAFNPGNDESDYESVSRLTKEAGLKVIAVSAPMPNRLEFSFGSISHPDAKTREHAVDLCKQAVDYAASLDCDIMTIWPGQDGFDYPFQVDYTKQYDDMIDSLTKIASYNPNMKIAIEYKWREPRMRLLADSASTIMMMANDCGKDNIGACIDIGHVLMANGNMAKDCEILQKHNKLFYMHINDCYGYWDDDMPVGSVRITEYLELIYSLKKIGYDGWCSVDIAPFREDSYRALEESVEFWDIYRRGVEKIGLDKLTECIKSGDTMNVYKVMRENLFTGI